VKDFFKSEFSITNKMFAELTRQCSMPELAAFETLSKNVNHHEKSMSSFIAKNFKNLNKLKKDLFNFLRGKTIINPLLISKEQILEKIKFYATEYSWEHRSNYDMLYRNLEGRDKLKLCIHVYVNQELKKDLLEKTLNNNAEYKMLFKELTSLKNEKARLRKKIFNKISEIPYC
jgi:hypothetical protein